MQAGSNAGQYNNGIMSENLDHIYKLLFHKYYANLLFYATRIVGEEEAEDVVQDVFCGTVATKRHGTDRRADTGIPV